LAPIYGWRFPFYIGAVPGFLLALAVLFLKEPERGQFDTLPGSPERSTVFGLSHNRAFLSATLGMAAMTFSLGGIQVWMPQFLYSERHYSLQSANFIFGVIIVVDGILASLAGGWLGDYLLRRMKSSYYLVSAVSMALGVPFMIVALFTSGPAMLPAIAVAAFFLLLNTSPLNAAVINSVDAHIRATAIAANIFIIHILGDVPSPTMMGWVADHRSLQIAFVLPVIAMVGSSAILFAGMKHAPTVRVDSTPTSDLQDSRVGVRDLCFHMQLQTPEKRRSRRRARERLSTKRFLEADFRPGITSELPVRHYSQRCFGGSVGRRSQRADAG
jgi:MFS transporter, Spinster family, sphingosine-1-phosphate transporter